MGVPSSPLLFTAVTTVTLRVLVHLIRARLSLFRVLRLTLLTLLLSYPSLTPTPSASTPPSSLPPPPLRSTFFPLLVSQSPAIMAALASLASSYWTLGSQVFSLASTLLPSLLPPPATPFPATSSPASSPSASVAANPTISTSPPLFPAPDTVPRLAALIDRMRHTPPTSSSPIPPHPTPSPP